MRVPHAPRGEARRLTGSACAECQIDTPRGVTICQRCWQRIRWRELRSELDDLFGDDKKDEETP